MRIKKDPRILNMLGRTASGCRQPGTLLAPSAKYREVFGEPHEGAGAGAGAWGGAHLGGVGGGPRSPGVDSETHVHILIMLQNLL